MFKNKYYFSGNILELLTNWIKIYVILKRDRKNALMSQQNTFENYFLDYWAEFQLISKSVHNWFVQKINILQSLFMIWVINYIYNGIHWHACLTLKVSLKYNQVSGITNWMFLIQLQILSLLSYNKLATATLSKGGHSIDKKQRSCK